MGTTTEHQKSKDAVLALSWIDIGAFGAVLACFVAAIVLQSSSVQVSGGLAAFAGGVILAAFVTHARARANAISSAKEEFHAAKKEAETFRTLRDEMKRKE
ncbi:hypothetical protein J3R80_12760 [Aliiroseovarius sp. Z3]|uniref:hypothetical protein n=1 Tax=Aliiroseovarius sp. Z3 TaxID=2811402 RepID=UPI0023B2A052|nr:hypothetical protein [Aliiroseovarius sp. Z3]MDE9451339.1 hypothetical protein [Aliiroseovarius sp. Z3]